ncbi:MAG: ABC transporter permease [Geminicoccaceae bacterium]
MAVRLDIERRLEPSLLWQSLSIVVALLASLAACALLLASAGADILAAVSAIYDGAFGSWKATVKTLVKASPLMLTGVAVTLAFRAKIWNIGAEGQLFAGAMMAYWAYVMCGWLPSFLLVTLIFAAGFLGGGLYGGLAGWLRSRFAVNEVLTTVMLNYIIGYFLSYMLVSGPWRDPSSFYQQTPRIDAAARLPPILPDSKLHLGFLIAVVMALAAYALLKRTSLGYEIRAVGFNPLASRFKGIRVERTAILVMVLSGGIAGLAGVSEVFGVHFRLTPEVSLGFGFTGIIVAMLAGLHPIAVVFVAILFGALINGGIKMQIATGVPSAMISAIEAIILLFFLAAAALNRYQFRLVSRHE